MNNFYVPRFEVEIEDKMLSIDIQKTIIDVTIEEKIDEGASFRLTIHDEFNLKTQEFKWLDNPLFKEGNKVAIKMGYGDILYTMIVGKITSLEPSFFSEETPTLSIGGQDLSFDYLKKGSPERTFVKKKYSDIARIISIEAGLIPVIDDTGNPIPVIQKSSEESYYAFLEKLKKKAGGYQFDIEGSTMYFIKPSDYKNEILSLELNKDIISFRPVFKTTGLVTEVEVRGHNPKDPTKPIIGKATVGSERPQEPKKKTGSQIAKERYKNVKKVITNVAVTSKEQADAIAKSELNKASDGLIEGDGECIGLPKLRKGVNIKLEKMGNRFSGKYFVKGTTHTINESGYRTRFSVKRNSI